MSVNQDLPPYAVVAKNQLVALRPWGAQPRKETVALDIESPDASETVYGLFLSQYYYLWHENPKLGTLQAVLASPVLCVPAMPPENLKMKLPTISYQRARRPEQIEERRDAILMAASALFVERGLENVSLSDIAVRVGTAKSNLYRYFESREHIYLIVLQQEGVRWEKRTLAALDKLDGNGSIESVATVLTECFAKSKTYCLLLSAINTILEKNLSVKLVTDFRSVFFVRRQVIGDKIVASIPGAKPEQIQPLMFSIFAHVAGLWPMSHPDPVSRLTFDSPENAHLRLDFEEEMSRFLNVILKGALFGG